MTGSPLYLIQPSTLWTRCIGGSSLPEQAGRRNKPPASRVNAPNPRRERPGRRRECFSITNSPQKPLPVVPEDVAAARRQGRSPGVGGDAGGNAPDAPVPH